MREAQQIVVLAKALGYTQREIAETLNIHESTVSKWYHGIEEPSVENWPNLTALKECLTTTGKLTKAKLQKKLTGPRRTRTTVVENKAKITPPRKPSQVFEQNKAKKGKSKSAVREIDNSLPLISNGKPLKVNSKGNPTVLPSDEGAPNCAKCPLKGNPG